MEIIKFGEFSLPDEQETITDIVENKETLISEGKDYYSVEYYAAVGEHGEVESGSDFKTMVKKAEAFLKREKKELGKDTLYIGVSGSGDDYAILYVHPDYLKVNGEQSFNSKEAYENWMKSAKECMSSKKTIIGKY